MNVLKIYIGLLVFGSSSLFLRAQSQPICYELFLKEGLAAQERFDFDLAIYKLEAAEICPDKPLTNKLDDLLKKVKEDKIKAITTARDQAKLSEEKAIEQLAISESNRLGFLANQEREKGNTEGALKLAFRAMEMVGDRASIAVQRAFGDAVYRHTLKELKGHKGAIQRVSFSNDGNLILTHSSDSTLMVWNNNGEQLLHLQAFKENLQAASFSPNGQYILTVSGKTVAVWNLQGQQIQELKGHQGLVYDAVFSHDGQMVATCSRDQSIKIWNWKTGQLRSTCKGVQAAVFDIQFSKDDSSLLGLSADKFIGIWNIKGELIRKIKHQDLYFGGASFGPKEGQLLTFTVNNALQIWELKTGRLLTEMKEHQRMVRQVAIAPDKTGFLSCSTDRLAIYWDVLGNAKIRFNDHLAGLNHSSFSDDGNYILTGSKDGTAKLYDNNGQLLMNLSGFSGAVNDVAISPDNQQIIAADQETVAFLCQNPKTYYPRLQKNPPKAFTKEEKEKYAILD